MKTSEVLNLAADAIERRGWAQGGDNPGAVMEPWGDTEPDAPVCLEGGIMAAMGVGIESRKQEWFDSCPAYRAMREYLRPQLRHYPRLYMWNDQDGRTKEEVIEALRAAALIEQAKENQTVKESVNV